MDNRAELLRIRARQNRNIALGFGIAVGLVVLAAVTLLNLPGNEGPSAAQEASVVPVSVNYPAPELALDNLDGQVQALTDFHDKVVLVNNWATWCPPCKAEMPTLVAFYNDHAKDGFMLVAVEAGDAQEQVQKFADQDKMTFAVWLDPDGKSLTAFQNRALPNSYVIDRSGTVRLAWTGPISRDMLEKYVTPILAGK